MKVVSEADAIDLFPSLIRGAKQHSVVISDGDRDLAAIVSMDDFEFVRKAKNDRFLTALHDLGDALRTAAAEEGISVDELEKMLDRKAPQSRD